MPMRAAAELRLRVGARPEPQARGLKLTQIVSSRSRGQSAGSLPRPRTELRRLRVQVARLDHLTRVQALALARIAGAHRPGTETDPADGALVRALLEALEARDPHTRVHCERVSQRAVGLARELGCPEPLVARLALAGALHDLGKIGIPDAILAKPGPLIAREWNTMRRHPELGARMLEPVASLADVALYVRHHHEWFDGTGHGYPDRLAGAQIPLPSRILAVADALEEMTGRRSYRRVRAPAEALDEIAELAGRRFDPEVVAAARRIAQRRSEELGRSQLRVVEDGA
jgi:HD-GYP domain-containing protein (c-di-GMP phosphodiesterase class II)